MMNYGVMRAFLIHEKSPSANMCALNSPPATAPEKPPEKRPHGNIPIRSAFFAWIDGLLTRLFLLGYEKPLCKATDPNNLLELIKHVEELDLDGYSEEELVALLEVAAESQSQAISHTEYEDAKAARALAPVAFLTTLGSVLLFKGVDIAEPGVQKLIAILIASAFVLIVVTGTLMVLWGIVPRFNLPRHEPRNIDRTFFAHIAQSAPEHWVGCWDIAGAKHLKRGEIRSRIIGAYLISGKVALKIAMLRRGMLWIFSSLILLLAGVVNFGIISYKETKMLIAIDADNTLWDTNAVYVRAQTGLIRGFCEAANLVIPENALPRMRAHDQRLAKGHAEGYRYPIADLLEELRKDWAGGQEIEDWGMKQKAIATAYENDLLSPPKPFPSLLATLEALRSHGKLLLVTEGHEDKIRAQLKALGIEASFDGIEIVVKSPRKFIELLKYADGTPAIMIGDQLDRDVEFARAAGWKTVWIPGGFRPDHEDPAALLALPDIVVGTLSEAPDAVDRLKRKPPEKAGQ